MSVCPTDGGGSTASFNASLQSDLAAVNGDRSRYGLGVCPSCSKGLTADEIAARLAIATAEKIEEIDVWAGVGVGDSDAQMWWDALRKWKAS